MRLPKYIVYYLAEKKRIRLGLSPDPALDYHYWQSQGYLYSPPRALSGPLPLFSAQRLLSTFTHKPFVEQNATFLQRLRLKWRSHRSLTPPLDLPSLPSVGQQELESLMRGKLYLWQELARLWRGEDLASAVQRLVLDGKCQLTAAVGQDSWGRLVCRRCGSTRVEPDRWCCKDTTCFQCVECDALGKASTCTALVAMARTGQDIRRDVAVKLAFSLTAAQSAASRKLVEFVQNQTSHTCLLWAVCGAGKTEVSYEAARIVLAKGGRVLFAIPRRSVVRELAERFKGAIGGVPIQALYGGVSSEQRRREAPLVIATTHQVLRFYRNFDLVILDEVDAFPYRGSQMLQRGVERSLRPGGKRIYMTATPDRAMLERAKGERWDLVRIPVRPHGHPLPVPVPLIDPSLGEEPGRLPLRLLSIIESSPRLFLFVPSVRLCKAVAVKLAKTIPKVASCHAQDPQRDQKLLAFRNGEIRVLVATSVAERGITVPGAEVMVLFANSQLFDEGVLVQMAGRSGRAWDNPTGRVWFVANSQSQAMVEAIGQIKEQNHQAEQLRLLTVA